MKTTNNTTTQDMMKDPNMVSLIDKDTEVLKQLNAELETKYAKYLSDDYNPGGKESGDLNQHVQELTDMKEQEEMLVQVDDALAEVMSSVLDVE